MTTWSESAVSRAIHEDIMREIETKKEWIESYRLAQIQEHTCIYCGVWVQNLDYGSKTYEEHYGHELPPICERCEGLIFRLARPRGSLEARG